MSLYEKLGKHFVITTELGPVKGAEFQASIDKAVDYDQLDGINIHDCPMGNLRINAVSMASIYKKRAEHRNHPTFYMP